MTCLRALGRLKTHRPPRQCRRVFWAAQRHRLDWLDGMEAQAVEAPAKIVPSVAEYLANLEGSPLPMPTPFR